MKLSNNYNKLIDIKNLSKIYNSDIKALNSINLDIYKGEFVGILGLSGSGKSTLLRSINRLVEPSKGDIFYKEKSILKLKGKDLRKIRSEISMIYQNFNLIKNASVTLNVLIGKLFEKNIISALFWSKNEKESAVKLLVRLGLEDKKDMLVSELSGGEQQRVAIARSLMQNSDVILADEPVASLDPFNANIIMKSLLSLNENKDKTIICSLHSVELAKKYCGRIIALNSGEILFDGVADDFTEELIIETYKKKES